VRGIQAFLSQKFADLTRLTSECIGLLQDLLLVFWRELSSAGFGHNFRGLGCDNVNHMDFSGPSVFFMLKLSHSYWQRGDYFIRGHEVQRQMIYALRPRNLR